MRIFYTAIFTVIAFTATAQTNNNFPVTGSATIYDYSPMLYLKRSTNDGGFVQGIQTQLLDGTNNWFYGAVHEGKWTVGKGDYQNEKLTVLNNGNVGISNDNPGSRLSFPNVDGAIEADGITWYSPTRTVYGIHRTAGSWTAPNYQQLRLGWETGIILDPGQSHGKSFVDIQGSGIRVSSGSVGIGTLDTKGYKLAVAGNMIAESVKVSLQANWPDYVFAKDYQLPTLQETEKHIKDKGHLPGIPSAAEVKANGIDLGEMNAKLLQKIEELTLHLIEKGKELELERLVNKNQEERLKKLELNNQLK